ncbi:MAG: condensation domain-containing protein [Chloroflexota bacterium]
MDRKLSLPEHMMCLASDGAPINFILTARILGRVSEDELRRALAKAGQKHPLLAVRVVDGENGRFHFIPLTAPTFPIRLVPRESDNTWQREVEQELTVHFDWRAGPLVRFVCVQDEAVTDLLVVCHHALTDGLSALYLIHNLMQFLGEPETAVTPLPLLPPADQMLPKAFLRRPAVVLKTTFIRAMLKAMAVQHRFKKSTPPPFTFQPTPNLAFQMISWRLAEEETTAVVQRAKHENTSVHAALCAAFLKTFAVMEGETSGWQRTVSSPISIRKRLAPPVGEDFGLFITLVETSADCQPERDFWQIAREIKQALTRDSADEKILAQSAISRYLQPGAPGLERFNDWGSIHYDLSITNLGRFEYPTVYGPLRLEAIFGPVVTTMETEKILGVTTVAGQLCFTFVFRPADLSLEQAQQIQTQAMAYLTAACR